MVKRKGICKRNRHYTCLKAVEIVRPTVKNTEMEMGSVNSSELQKTVREEEEKRARENNKVSGEENDEKPRPSSYFY